MIARSLPRVENTGGVSGQAHSLATALTHRGHEVTVFGLNPPPDPAEYQYRRIPVPDSVRAHTRLLRYVVPWWISRLPVEEFDVVHAHGDDHFIRTHRPLVRTFYGSERAEARYSRRIRHRLFHLSMAPLERISLWRATVVVCISASTQKYFKRKAVVIPCGYDPGVFFPGDVKAPQPTILFVGDLNTRKRGDLLLRAFAEVVRPTIPTAELWLVSPQPADAPGVHWIGQVPASDLADSYRRAWVFCLPSSYEGFGVPYLEAMASGTPVVATPNGGAEEVLDSGRAGRIVGERHLGTALLELLTQKTVREDLAARGLERARQYRISEIARRYESLYQEALERVSAEVTREQEPLQRTVPSAGGKE